MSKFSAYILFILMLAAAMGTACGRHGNATLSHAEAIMEQHPDSALSLLDTINPSTLTSDAARAKYALLLTQASMKNRIIPQSDSLINTAAAYYKDKGNADEMKSLFYQGNVRFYNNDYTSAIIPAMQAHDLAVKQKDDYWRAKTAEQIADIYAATLYDNTSYREEAIDYYQRAGKIPNHRYAICDLALDLANKTDYYKSIHLFDSIVDIALHEPTPDSALALYGYRPLLPIYLRCKRVKDASSVYENLCKYSGFQPTFLEYTYIADLETRNGNPDNGLTVINAIRPLANDKTEKMAVYNSLSEYYDSTGRYDMSKLYVDSILWTQNAAVRNALDQSVISEQRDLYEAISTAEKIKSQRLNVIIILSVILFLIIVSGMAVLFYLNSRKKNLEIELKIKEILSLNAAVDSQRCDIELLSEKIKDYANNRQRMADNIKELFKDKWSSLNIICNQYFINELSDKDSASVICDLDKEIDKLRKPKSLLAIEQTVNHYMDNIVGRLRDECSFLKKDEITLITLIYAGLSVKAICVFTNTNLKYFYVKKRRIISKIKESDAPSKELFITNMH